MDYPRGLELLRSLLPDTDERLDHMQHGETDLRRYSVGFVYGDLCQRPQLNLRDRQVVVLAALAAMGGCEDALAQHVALSRAAGVTPEEIYEIFLHVAAYAGFPRAINATNVAVQVLGEESNPRRGGRRADHLAGVVGPRQRGRSD